MKDFDKKNNELIQNKLSNLLAKEFINIFVDIVNREGKPNRSTKYTIEYYLYYILIVLKRFTKMEYVTILF